MKRKTLKMPTLLQRSSHEIQKKDSPRISAFFRKNGRLEADPSDHKRVSEYQLFKSKRLDPTLSLKLDRVFPWPTSGSFLHSTSTASRFFRMQGVQKGSSTFSGE